MKLNQKAVLVFCCTLMVFTSCSDNSNPPSTGPASETSNSTTADADGGAGTVTNSGTTTHTDVVNADSQGLAPSQSPVISRDNYQQFLLQAFSVYFGTAYDARLPTEHIYRLAEGKPTSVFVENDVENSTYTCSNGGTVQRRVRQDIVPATSISYQLGNCQYQADLINGKLGLSGFPDVSFENIALVDFSISFGDAGEMKANGGYRRYSGFAGSATANPDDHSEHWRAEHLDYSLAGAGNNLTVIDANTRAYYGYASMVREPDNAYWKYSAQLEGGFSMMTPFAAHAIVTVSTPEPLSEKLRVDASALANDASVARPYDNPPLPRFTTGTMIMEAADGSSLELNAETDDRQTVRLILRNSNLFDEFIANWEQFDAGLLLRNGNTLALHLLNSADC